MGVRQRRRFEDGGRCVGCSRATLALAGALWLLGSPGLHATRLAESSTQEPAPGVAASPEVVRELQGVLGLAIRRFEAKDPEGVLAYVSDQYRTGPFTKAGLRSQLFGIYGVYDTVRAQVRIDDVRMVGEHAWVYSTGEVSGRLPWVSSWVRFLTWRRELEVARREGNGWRLFGYQQ
jgi:hypothetical protein